VLIAEHGRRWKTIGLVTRNYWWPEVTKYVGKNIKICDLCQRMKNRIQAPVGKLIVNEIPEKLWTHLIVNISDSGLDLYYKVIVSSRKECNFSCV